MKRTYILAFFLIILVVTLSNIPPISYIFDYALDDKHYRYANHSESFNVTDRSGNNIIGVKKSFKVYLIGNNLKPVDTVLYRTFWKNPFAFWRWHSYLNSKDDRYKLPYKN